MFDEEKKIGQAPNNLPFAPEPPSAHGMSSGSASSAPDALDAGLLRRKEGGTEMPPTADSHSFSSAAHNVPGAIPPSVGMVYATKEPVLGKILAAVLTVLAVGGVVVGGWYGYTRIVQPLLKGTTARNNQLTTTNTLDQPSQSSTATVPVYQASTTPEDVQMRTNNDVLISGEQVDTDLDFLPDRRERELGTDPLRPDSDRDGLNDGDEVLVFVTDPLNPDSDADGYQDGEEVRNGYNPLGAGKLFGKPTSTIGMTSSTNASSSVPQQTTSTPVTHIPSL